MTHIHHISAYAWIALCRSGHTYTHSRRKFRHEWHSSSDWPVSVGKFIQSSQNLSLGTCICSGRILRPRVVPQRSHKTHRCTFKRVDARYHWLPMKHFLILLTHSIWHTPSETRRSASCLKLYTKALNPKHLLHETLYLKPSPKSLRSRKPLRSFVELLSIHGEPTTPVPAALQSLIPAFGPQPPGFELPRNAWVQLNRADIFSL